MKGKIIFFYRHPSSRGIWNSLPVQLSMLSTASMGQAKHFRIYPNVKAQSREPPNSAGWRTENGTGAYIIQLV